MENLRAVRDRVRSRLCAAHAHSSLRNLQRQGMMPSRGFRGRTGIAVARVFKGNVIFTRIRKNLARKEWIGKKKAFMIKFRSLVAGFTGGSAHSDAQVFFEELAAKRKFFKGRGAATLDDELKKKIAEDTPTIRFLRAIAVPVIGNVCHVFMHQFNRTEVYGLEKLEKALMHRRDGQGLVTVSNHVAAMDDPLVTASLLSPQMLLHERMLRWTLCATDRCFTSVPKSVLFTSLKVLPVSRGQGIYQEGMDLALEKLNRGDWVHIFPEGSRSRDGGKTIGSAKRGVGRLILDAEITPLIIPFIHDGMQEVLPIGSKFPHICKKVTVLVGDPIPVDDLVARCNSKELSSDDLYDAIAQRIGETMQNMKAEVDQLVADGKIELAKKEKLYLARRASGIWERVDWEMEGFSVEDLTEERMKQTDTREVLSARSTPEQQEKSFDNPWQQAQAQIGGITTRLRSYGDSAAFMSFAAKGLGNFNPSRFTPSQGAVVW